MELQASEAMTSAYDIDKVRRDWIGKVVRNTRGRYPVEHEPIRQHCYMVEDDNPLFLDPAAAAEGPYGVVIAPPCMAPVFCGGGIWPRNRTPAPRPPGPVFALGVPVLGDNGINMGSAWEYLLPMRVGDHISSETIIADVFVKAIKLDPLAVWITTETRYINQRSETVATCRNTVLFHRSPKDIRS